jgi:Outer membrane protein beta-barrel domain
MKKLLVIIAISAISFKANSQFKLGVQAGIAASNLKWKGFEDAKNLSKPTFGIVAQANLGGMLFNPSVNYLQTGFRNTETITIPNGTVTTEDVINFNNLEIPLDIIVPVKTKSGKFLFSIAPVITVGLKGTYENTETTVFTSLATPQTINTNMAIDYGTQQGEIKKTDWGGRLGIGYQFKNGLQLNANYKAGFTNVNNDSDKFKNNALTITAAYFFIK